MKQQTTSPSPRRLQHHRHTGKLLHHRHTSYASLLFILLCVGILLGGITTSVRADYLSVSARVDGPLPAGPARITSPEAGKRFSAIPITVSGTCPDDNVVKLFRNNVYSGETICSNGTFAIETDLFLGHNSVQAKVFNFAEQEGPVSDPIDLYYDPPASSPLVQATEAQKRQSAGTPGSPVVADDTPVQLIVKTGSSYRGYYPNETVQWPMEIVGGTAPYAVNVDWGDGKNDLVIRKAPGKFVLAHTYPREGKLRGAYTVRARTTDANGQTATMQGVIIVNDPALAGAERSRAENNSLLSSLVSLMNHLAFGWSVYALLVLMVICFWLGERREKGILLSELHKPRRHAH